MPHERLEALIVDVGGTLIDDTTWIARPRYEALLLTRLTDAFGAERPWYRVLITHQVEDPQAPPWEQHTVEAVIALAADHGERLSTVEAARACRAMAAPMPELVKLAPGADAAVRELRSQGVRLALCSNTWWRDDDDLRRDWEAFGLADCFEAFVTSHSARVAKPSPAIFELALKPMGVPPSAAAAIGDRPERDVAAARAVGMRSLWMRPPDFNADPDPPPDATVSTWPAAVDVVLRWR